MPSLRQEFRSPHNGRKRKHTETHRFLCCDAQPFCTATSFHSCITDMTSEWDTRWNVCLHELTSNIHKHKRNMQGACVCTNVRMMQQIVQTWKYVSSTKYFKHDPTNVRTHKPTGLHRCTTTKVAAADATVLGDWYWGKTCSSTPELAVRVGLSCVRAYVRMSAIGRESHCFCF